MCPKSPCKSRVYASETEIDAYRKLVSAFKSTPVPDVEILENLSLFLTRPVLGQLLFMNELYKQILHSHGVIMEFGVRWGRNLSLFSCMRNLYEPYNFSRKIIGFDTFSGFPHTSSEDGTAESVQPGLYSVSEHYEDTIEAILSAQEAMAPRPHLKKYEIIKGDVCLTLPEYLNSHPESIVALAYFDLDLYRPTKECLFALKNYMAKGSVIGFDEICLAEYPGETVALRECLDMLDLRLQRSPFSPYQSFVVL